MERLQGEGRFEPPKLESLEQVAEQGIRLSRGNGRVFVDLWEVEQLSCCSGCGPSRRERLRQMNLEQRVPPRVVCDCEPTTAPGDAIDREMEP